MENIIFVIDGNLIAHSNITTWPTETSNCDKGYCNALSEMSFYYMRNLIIRGRYDENPYYRLIQFISTIDLSYISGRIDGQGYGWWWYAISCALPSANHSDTRGDMLYIYQSENILIEGLSFINSPKYHLNLKDNNNITVRNFVIEVDVFRQKKLFSDNGLLDENYGIPTFPLNTDGIDPASSNVHIYNGSITNFDDAVAFKPCRTDYLVCNSCANGLVENLQVTYSVGMTIGSVPPNINTYCIKDVTFRNITMKQPLKGIYIKSNPGDAGKGIIQNILYENIFMTESLWWPIWYRIHIYLIIIITIYKGLVLSK